MAQIAVAVVMLAAGVYKGQQARKQKWGESEAYLDASGRRQAAMTRDVAEVERTRNTIVSRAQAVAAASGGGGIGTTGMTAIMGDLYAEGEYNILAKMWQGLNDAEALTFRAEAARREGDAAFEAGVIEGVTSAVSAYFGMGGSPNSTPSISSNYTATIRQPGGLDLPGYGTIARGGATA